MKSTKKTITVFVIVAIIFAVLAVACFIYQANLEEATEANASMRFATYYGLPACAIVAVISAVVAIALKVRNRNNK